MLEIIVRLIIVVGRGGGKDEGGVPKAKENDKKLHSSCQRVNHFIDGWISWW